MLIRRIRGFSPIKPLAVTGIVLWIVTGGCGFTAVPRSKAVQKHTRELAALQTIKTIQQAQAKYYSEYGRYAISLTELGPPASGRSSASAAGLIGTDLAGGEKQGFMFTVNGSAAGYAIIASPLVYGASSEKNFFSDQTMTIHVNDGPELATAESREIR